MYKPSSHLRQQICRLWRHKNLHSSHHLTNGATEDFNFYERIGEPILLRLGLKIVSIYLSIW